MKLALAANVKTMRQQKKMTQQELAKRIGSSQSRVAKMAKVPRDPWLRHLEDVDNVAHAVFSAAQQVENP